MNKKAFITLVELLIVIAIIGLLSAILIPVIMGSTSSSNNLKGTINNNKIVIGGFTYQVVTIDDCQYLKGSHNNAITHKGDCINDIHKR